MAAAGEFCHRGVGTALIAEGMRSARARRVSSLVAAMDAGVISIELDVAETDR